ncbi:polysaccharide pyruvyl transferase CsaB [Lysinibacillus antri]|uniref:Polysaccharide pyruvyl transferase CsaB n=1 Tax=Lysinibacillus antri TaxID=2498145 RepID=A0A3S0P672_9BACI|nr:polysaccharide pyruvyl transferase CsaB [Lysinibacillus antri]RUL53199.1 polysaccharide pyruvyl transferase CsaB [Lysinibacillus antri]
MHVVLSGYYGFDNVGDEAILFSIIHALRKCQENIEITVLSNNPPETEKTYGVKAVNRWKLKEIRDALKNADGLISGGGSLLQDQTGMKSIPYYTGIMQIAKMCKKPVFVYAQGMGPINSGISKWITRAALNKVDRITVRDEDSKALLTTIGVKQPVSIVPDPVIGLDHSSFHSEWLESNVTKPYIAVSVRDWPTAVPYKEKIAQALDELVRKGETVLFVPMHGEHDAKSSREVASLMKEMSMVSPADLSLEEKITIIGGARLLIGMRLHSLIFSAIYYTPFIAISYDPKIDAFADIAQQPVIGHVEKDNWDGTRLADQAMELLEQRDMGTVVLRNRVEPMQAEALLTAKLALETFA